MKYNDACHRLLIPLFLILAFASPGFSQKAMILKGTVQDASSNLPLQGVTVLLKGVKTKGVISDAKGNFSLTITNGEDSLIISHTGYESQIIPVNNRTTIQVLLNPDAKAMENVVVIGYGKVTKRDLTGSVGVAPVKDMLKAPVSSYTEALSGRIAGVQVSAQDGQPGGEMNIVIRGAGSLTQSNSPLFVVDGFPVESMNAVALNPEEIESLTVLKDASSTAIYGSRAANGVILIVTKRGKESRPVFSFNNSIGFQSAPKQMEVMSPYEFVKYQQELYPASNNTPLYFTGGKTLEDYKSVKGINFQDLIFNPGAVQSYNMALRGGNYQTRYSISGSFYNQQGTIVNTGLKRYSGRVTLDQAISKKIKAGITANYSGVRQYGQVIDLNTLNNSSGMYNLGNPSSYALTRAWMYRPVTYDSTVDLLNDPIDLAAANTSDFMINPYIDLKNQHQFNSTNLLQANGYVSYNIRNDLIFKSTFGIFHNLQRIENFFNSKTVQGATYPGSINANGVNGYVVNNLTSSFSNENTLSYKKIYKGGSSFTALALFAMNSSDFSSYGYGGRLLPNESLGISGLDEGIPYYPFANMTTSSNNTMASYATRLDYSYKSRYIITATFRADGSSKFAHPWGYFPGAALAWNMDKERFFAKAFPFISTSKLRASYGSNGNNRVKDFGRFAQLTQSPDGYSFNNSTPSGNIYETSPGNPDLKWETVRTIDVGYEIGLFNQRINLEVDLYRKTTNDLLLQAQLPASTGFTTALKNIGKMKNEGIEFTLSASTPVRKSFSWNGSFNISFNRNKVLQLTSGQYNLTAFTPYYSQFNNPLYISEVGKSTGMMIGYVWQGNYQYSDFDSPAPGVYILKPSVASNGNATSDRAKIQPGDIKYKDLNGDGIMNNADITIIGRGQPIHTGGVSNNFSYRSISLNVFLQWSYGNDIFNANRLLMEGNSNAFANRNQFASYVNRWSPQNQTNINYRAGGQGPIGYYSSRVVEDGSFLRLKTVSLSYSVPAKYIKRLLLSNLSFNVVAQNLYTWTKYSGLDPEVSTRNGNVQTPGYDFSAYPKSPTIAFSLQAAF